MRHFLVTFGDGTKAVFKAVNAYELSKMLTNKILLEIKEVSRQVTGPDGTLFNNNGSGWTASGPSSVPATDGTETVNADSGDSTKISVTPTPLPDSIDQALVVDESGQTVFTES